MYTPEGRVHSVLHLGGDGDERALRCGDGDGGLWVAGTFQGTMSAPGVEIELVATGTTDVFLYTEPLDGATALRHWAEGAVESIAVAGSFSRNLWGLCAQHEGEMTVHAPLAPPLTTSSLGGSDIVCSLGSTWLPARIGGPGEETLRGFVSTDCSSNAGPGVPDETPVYGVVGGSPRVR